MRLKAAIAVVGASAACGGGLGLEVATHRVASSREAAITAEVCRDIYGSQDESYEITQHTIDCMNNGWVPGGRVIHPDVKAGDDTGFLDGYIKIESARANHLDLSPALLFGIFAVCGAGFLVMPPSKEENISDPEDDPDGARETISDQEIERGQMGEVKALWARPSEVADRQAS